MPSTQQKSKQNKKKPKIQNALQTTLSKEIVLEVKKPQLILVLQGAGLELSRRTKKPELLNFQDNGQFIKERLRIPPEVYQPQVVHQCLLNLMDSPLNKEGYLKVFIKTLKGRLIEVSRKTRIPRTYHRFSPLIAQLLNKQKILSPEDGQVLLKVSKESLQDLIPQNCLRVGIVERGKVVNLRQHIGKIDLSSPVAFFIKLSTTNIFEEHNEKVHEQISISKYPLSSCYTMTRVLLSFEDIWKTA